MCSDKIKALLLARGESVRELARAINVPQATLQHIFSGKTKKPRSDVLAKLAEYFSVNITDIIGTTSHLLDNEEINVYALKDCHLENRTVLSKIVFELSEPGNYIALAIDSDEYAPFLPKASVIIINTSKKIEDRNTIVFFSSLESKIFIERIILENGTIYIKKKSKKKMVEISLLKVQPPRDKILGVVMEIRYKLPN